VIRLRLHRRNFLAAIGLWLSLLAIPPATAKSPLPVWFMPSTWYPYVSGPGGDVPGKGPGWNPGYVLQGDFNAMFEPGAKWDPSKVQVLEFDTIDLFRRNPGAKQIAEWAKVHPNVKIAVVLSMLTVGPDSHCVSDGGPGYPSKGTPISRAYEGVEYHTNFSKPGWNYSQGAMNALKGWKEMGGRVDIILMDIPLAAGLRECSFSIPQTVSFMVPLANQVLSIYPNVQFSLEQGPVGWTDDEWIAHTLQFLQEFPKQIINPETHQGIRVTYANLDLHLDGDIRKPPTPMYTTDGRMGTINKVTEAFRAAGLDVAVNINTFPKPGETQAEVISRLHSYMKQAVDSGIPFEHILLAPFAIEHKPDWVVMNLPDTSPSALTWLLQQPY